MRRDGLELDSRRRLPAKVEQLVRNCQDMVASSKAKEEQTTQECQQRVRDAEFSSEVADKKRIRAEGEAIEAQHLLRKAKHECQKQTWQAQCGPVMRPKPNSYFSLFDP